MYIHVCKTTSRNTKRGAQSVWPAYSVRVSAGACVLVLLPPSKASGDNAIASMDNAYALREAHGSACLSLMVAGWSKSSRLDLRDWPSSGLLHYRWWYQWCPYFVVSVASYVVSPRHINDAQGGTPIRVSWAKKPGYGGGRELRCGDHEDSDEQEDNCG